MLVLVLLLFDIFLSKVFSDVHLLLLSVLYATSSKIQLHIYRELVLSTLFNLFVNSNVSPFRFLIDGIAIYVLSICNY